MTPVPTPLELSAASFRMVGYMIETNMRVAQVFGMAAVEANPFFGTPRVKGAGRPAPAKAVSARDLATPARPRAGTPPKKAAPAETVETSNNTSVTDAVISAVPQAPASTKSAPMEKSSVQPAKRTREPSAPPAMPAPVSDAGKPDA